MISLTLTLIFSFSFYLAYFSFSSNFSFYFYFILAIFNLSITEYLNLLIGEDLSSGFFEPLLPLAYVIHND